MKEEQITLMKKEYINGMRDMLDILLDKMLLPKDSLFWSSIINEKCKDKYHD